MIALVAASSIYLLATQAVVAAPTNAYKACLKATSAKAKSEKVAGDAYEAYTRSACAAQMTALTNALIAFETKNGMARKTAAEDARMTVDDYLASSVDNYKFLAGVDVENKKAEDAAAAARAAPAATPAAQPTQAAAPKPPK